MRFHLVALGCKLNQAEAEDMQRELLSLGQDVVTSPQEAEWAIINTCTVTHVAARKSRRMIRHLRRQNPALRIAVTGCYAQMLPQEAVALPGVELLISNEEKDTLVRRLLTGIGNLKADQQVPNDPAFPQPLTGGHTRAFVRIQDGCDNSCAYCIVTIARGPSRSRPADAVVDEVRRRIQEGYREIVLTGVNIGSFGRDSALSTKTTLASLVQRLLAGTPIERLRLSSLEPWDVDVDLLSLWRDPRLCRQLHLPLQSGCDHTLSRMGRLGDTAAFAEVVALTRQAIPGLSLTTDLIVGFPGETDDEFAQTLHFVERMGFARLHVFKFSRRPGTLADQLPLQIEPEIIQRRSKQLIALDKSLRTCFHQQCVGRQEQVLFETERMVDGNRVWSGLTDTYVRISVFSDEELANQVRSVFCLSADHKGVWAELVDATSH